MTLEDFEKSLECEGQGVKGFERGILPDESKKHHRHHRHYHEDGQHQHRHKRRKRSSDIREGSFEDPKRKRRQPEHSKDGNSLHQKGEFTEKQPATVPHVSNSSAHMKRDSWMEEPSSLNIDYIQKGAKKPPEQTASKSSKVDFELKIHKNELNKHHLQNLADGKKIHEDSTEEPSKHEVNYRFGDAGAQWRMTKLNGVYRRAQETGRPVDDVAVETLGDLREFDDFREEQVELERRETYGVGYVGKEKPGGELFKERQSAPARHLDHPTRHEKEMGATFDPPDIDIDPPSNDAPAMDQTTLNRLKAQMLKAKAIASSDAKSLESEYNNALAAFATRKQPDVVVLGAMDNRMLAGGPRGEVKNVDNKRGRARGLVKDNEDMSIDDMVREERPTRNQAGGDGKRFAERIVKDGKFDNDLEYMEENANKLAQRVQRSDINLKHTAISDVQKVNRILEKCPLCFHEDTDTPPIAPVVSLATRVYLTLPTEPEISDGGASIIPVQHRSNLLECDDDEWEEIRNFMKSLTRMYHDQGRDVIFYENAAAPQRKKHAGIEVVPLPYSLGETAAAFFKEAILTSDEEWTQHKKIIDTLAKARQGQGRLAFRRSLAKEMPYFHVWFELDGGLGHIVEDANRWPKGDLFAREVIGGMLDREPDVIKRQGRWSRGGDRRVDGFKKRWKKFDWTRILAG